MKEKELSHKDKSELLIEGIKVGGPLLLAAAIIVMRHRESAEDVVQDTYLKAVRHLDSFRGDSQITTWMHKIMRNVAIDRHEHQKAKSKELLTDSEFLNDRPDDSAGPEELALREERKSEMLARIKLLPTSQQPDVLMYMHGYKLEEIAEQLQKPLGTVKANIHRAKRSLKEMIEAEL